MRHIVLARRFPGRQLPLQRHARVPVTLLQTNACSPLATNAIRGQHLGQFLLRILQDAALGRHDHRLRSVHRRAEAVPDAGRRPRLHAGAVAGQRLVDRAVPAEQQRRPVQPEPVGRGADGGVQRLASARCSGRSGATQDAVLGDAHPGHDRPDHGDAAICASRSAICPTSCAARRRCCRAVARSCSTRGRAPRSARSRPARRSDLLANLGLLPEIDDLGAGWRTIRQLLDLVLRARAAT